LNDRGISGGTIVTLDGDFDLAQRDRVIDAFEAAAGEPLVVIDLLRARYIDSTVLSCLLRLRDEVGERGGTLILTGPQASVKRLLDVAGLAPLFDIRPSVADVCREYDFNDGELRRIDLVVEADE
jgi:anti-sigma B factor antagonist